MKKLNENALCSVTLLAFSDHGENPSRFAHCRTGMFGQYDADITAAFPPDQMQIIKSYSDKGEAVCMIGDGAHVFWQFEVFLSET